MSYSEYHKKYQLPFEDEILVAYFFSQKVSYLCNCLFFRSWLVPNLITLAMLLSALAGGIFMVLPFWCFKLAGYGLMHVWFVLDCWDGEVARQTKRFSVFGKEFDYVVHLIAQPVMLYAIYRSTQDPLALRLIPYYIVVDTIKRGLFNLTFSRNHEIQADKSVRLFGSIRRMVNYVFRILGDEPNFILLMPILVFFHWVKPQGLFVASCLLVDVLVVSSMSLKLLRTYLADAQA